MAKTRPRNTSAHHEPTLPPAWFPRARINGSTHVLAPRTFAGARATGTATAPRAARAHCDSAKGGTRCPRRKMLLPQKTQISRRLLRPSRPGELPGSPRESPAAISPYTKSIAQFPSPTTQYQKHTLLCKIESSYQILRPGQRATDRTRKVLPGRDF